MQTPTFDQIELRRQAAGISKVALCQRADVNRETYRRTARARTSPNTRTLRKLSEALNALLSERVAHLQAEEFGA